MGTPELIANAPSYDTVRSSVLNILKKKIIVGHGMEHDFEVLDYYPPAATIRDSAKYFKLGKTPSLKSLVDRYLDMQIQSGEHSSVEDAQAVMKLYLMFRDKWEAGRNAGADQRKVMWAKQWLNRRRNKENFNKKFGVETS